MEKLSALIFSKDSDIEFAADLAKELQDIADEVVLIDSSNRQNREKLAALVKSKKIAKLKIFYAVPLGYVELVRAYGLKKCTNEWVLYLDSDERLSEGLKRDIRKIIESTSASAFLIRRNEHEVEGLHTWQLRLFKRSKTTYRGIVDEFPTIKGKVENLTAINSDYFIDHGLMENGHLVKGKASVGWERYMKFWRMSYKMYEKKLSEYTDKLMGQRNSWLSGLTLGMLRAYERVTFKKSEQEVGPLEYRVLHGLRLTFLRGLPEAFRLSSRIAAEINKYRSEDDANEMFEITKIVDEKGIIQYLGLDSEKTIMELNRKYRDKPAGLALLAELLKEKYRSDLKNRKPRVCFVTNSLLSFGGGEKWVLELAKRISKDFDVTIANAVHKNAPKSTTMAELSREYPMESIEARDVECRGLSFRLMGTDSYEFLIPKSRGKRSLYEAVRNSDIVYQLSANPMLLMYSIIYSRSEGKPLIVGVHNPTFQKIFEGGAGPVQKLQVRLYTNLLSQVRYFHVLTKGDEETVARNLPKAKSFLIPVFLTRRPKADSPNAKEFIALFVGRLAFQQKGIDLLSDVVGRTVKQNDRVVFHIMGGSGDGEQAVDALAKAYPRNVKKLGFLPEKEWLEEFRNASLFISTSRYEGMPAAVLDAQTHGLPVIAFDIKGIDSIITKEKQGRLVRGFDTEHFSSAVIDYYNMWKESRRHYSRIKRDISANIELEYGSERIIPMLDDMFRSLLESRPRQE